MPSLGTDLSIATSGLPSSTPPPPPSDQIVTFQGDPLVTFTGDIIINFS